LIFRVGGGINVFNRGIDGYGSVRIKIKNWEKLTLLALTETLWLLKFSYVC
jgi:hypothetical protein